MILGPGTHRFRVSSDLYAPDYVSVSARAPSTLTVLVNEEIVEDVFVGSHSPHTWWTHNSLFGRRRLTVGDIIEIQVGPDVKLRIEGETLDPA